MTNHQKSTIIIGGGVAGLTAAYELGKNGVPVILLERSGKVGGLANTIDMNGVMIEQYYHFICKADLDYFILLEELGIADKLNWETGITKFYYSGKMYRFATPFDLMFFSAVPVLGRFRFGLNIIKDRFHRDWEELDKIPAREWLIKQIGKDAYQVIWDPLLRGKFGDYHDQISAAWIWHRIWRVAKSRKHIWEPETLGYLSGGSQTLIDTLKSRLEEMQNVEIRTSTIVSRINTENDSVRFVELSDGVRLNCSSVVSTITLNNLSNIIEAGKYRDTINNYKYIGVICGLFKLKHPISDGFWVNINDDRIPFNGIIEFTNLNRRLQRETGVHIAYIPYYISESHPRFSYSDQQLKKEFMDGLQIINPEFNESWVLEYRIGRSLNAQAICHVGFNKFQLSHKTSLNGLFITDSTLSYPEDRTISSSIRQAKQVAKMIMQQGN